MSDYDQDEWYDQDEDRRMEEEADDLASRPYRFFYHFNDRVYADVGADDEISEAWLDYLRTWARAGVIQSWKIVRIADNVTLAEWHRAPSPIEAEDHDHA